MSKDLNAYDCNGVYLSGNGGKIFKLDDLLGNNSQLILTPCNEPDDRIMMVTQPEQSSNSFMTTEANTRISSMLPQCSNILQIIPTSQYTTTLSPHVVYSSQFTPQFATAVQSSTELVNTQNPVPQTVADQSSDTEEDESPSNQSIPLDSTPGKTGASHVLQILSESAKSQAEDFVTQLHSIVTTPMNVCQSSQEVLDPKEVMKFYHMLPEEKKVFKTKRTKYRKYSLATEFQMFRRSGVASEQESVATAS